MTYSNAWDVLGAQLSDALTAEEALDQSGLSGWNTRKVPLAGVLEDGTLINVPGRYTVVRDSENSAKVIGESVSDAYVVVQNEDMCPMLDMISEETGASFVSAGSMDDDRKVFVTMELPYTVKVGKVDEVAFYLTAITSHDGSMATTLLITPVRLSNRVMFNMEFRSTPNQMRVRHVKSVSERLERQVEDIMSFVYDFTDSFSEEAEGLFRKKLTRREFHCAVTKVMGAPDSAPASTKSRSENRVDAIVDRMDSYFDDPLMNGTVWSALSAMVEWGTHYSEIRGASDSESARAMKSLIDTSQKKIFRKILENL